ncbi:hypothetical protein, partial [Enterobacter quasiroggenkampii]|uniref:hypothetical protein n=1 Tax=Enterobacter quasiroggenkampii TaxID=2497436 RepID=UPI003F66B25C|nr:hypothetical protein [Enterobacter quasiroggenkampii]
ETSNKKGRGRGISPSDKKRPDDSKKAGYSDTNSGPTKNSPNIIPGRRAYNTPLNRRPATGSYAERRGGGEKRREKKKGEKRRRKKRGRGGGRGEEKRKKGERRRGDRKRGQREE